MHKQVSSVFERIGRFDIITFVDRLSVLKLHPLIKQALVDENISYTQAKVIKSKLIIDSEIIKIIDVLKNKKLSVNELKTYIDNMKNSNDFKNINNSSSIYDNVNKSSKSLSKKTYLNLKNEDKLFVDQKLKEIENIYLQIENKLKK